MMSFGYDTISKWHSAVLQNIVDDAMELSTRRWKLGLKQPWCATFRTEAFAPYEMSPKFAQICFVTFKEANTFLDAALLASEYLPQNYKTCSIDLRMVDWNQQTGALNRIFKAFIFLKRGIVLWGGD